MTPCCTYILIITTPNNKDYLFSQAHCWSSPNLEASFINSIEESSFHRSDRPWLSSVKFLCFSNQSSDFSFKSLWFTFPSNFFASQPNFSGIWHGIGTVLMNRDHCCYCPTENPTRLRKLDHSKLVCKFTFHLKFALFSSVLKLTVHHIRLPVFHIEFILYTWINR